MNAAQRVICPKCGRADAVRKVSAIVAQGTRMGETTAIGLGLEDRSLDLMTFVGTSTSRSALAAMLAPPAKPTKPHGYGCVAALIFSRLGLVLFVGLLLIGAILLSFPLLINTYSQNRMLLLIPIAILILFVISAVWLLARAGIHDVRAMDEERGSYEARLQAWEHATKRWQELYYCARDDGVFMPNGPRVVPVQRTKEIIRVHDRKIHAKL